MPEPLDLLLRRAAQSSDWEQAIAHRCAWCQRLMRADGTPLEQPLAEQVLATHGMCNACAVSAVARLAARRVTRNLLQAA